MNKNYFIRIDDLQPWMDKNILENIIKFFDSLSIKPLIAVIPEWPEDKYFWNKIKELQNNAWIIGLHWYDHKLRKNSSWTKSIIPIQNYSEFVGLPYEKQKEKIKKWLEIFKIYWLKTNVFVAPAHWLDKFTIKALKEFDFRYISDWFWLYPKKIDWLIFLPQQLWQYRYLPIWYKTICLHLEDFENLNNNILKNIEKNKDLFWDFDNLLNVRSKNYFEKMINFIFEKLWFKLLKIKKW